MEANELRIGNWVKDGNDFEQVTIDHLNCLNSRRCEFDSIPLTKEWLLKLGFKEYMSESDLRISIGGGVLMQFHFGVNQIECWIGDEISKNNVIYIHQLQNLYFALTGEELTFKSE